MNSKIKSLFKNLFIGILIVIDVSLFLFILYMIVPTEDYLTVVAIIVAILSLLTPLYLEVYKIKNAIKTPVSLTDRLDPNNDKIVAYPDDYSYATIETATTTNVSMTAGYIREIRVLGGALGDVTVYDNVTKSGSKIVPTVLPNKGQILKKDCYFATGLTITTKAATIIVVSYRGIG